MPNARISNLVLFILQEKRTRNPTIRALGLSLRLYIFISIFEFDADADVGNPKERKNLHSPFCRSEYITYLVKAFCLQNSLELDE